VRDVKPTAPPTLATDDADVLDEIASTFDSVDAEQQDMGSEEKPAPVVGCLLKALDEQHFVIG
jgi:hypothetical protein